MANILGGICGETIRVLMPGGKVESLRVLEWTIEEDFLTEMTRREPTEVEGLSKDRYRLESVLSAHYEYVAVPCK